LWKAVLAFESKWFISGRLLGFIAKTNISASACHVIPRDSEWEAPVLEQIDFHANLVQSGQFWVEFNN
jgi:hypothetical protein